MCTKYVSFLIEGRVQPRPWFEINLAIPAHFTQDWSFLEKSQLINVLKDHHDLNSLESSAIFTCSCGIVQQHPDWLNDDHSLVTSSACFLHSDLQDLRVLPVRETT